MSKTIEELEYKIKELKKKQLHDKWENYLTNLKSKLELLKGKTIISWYQNGKFTIFKIKDIKEKYYGDREGFYGQWSPKRWLEIETYGYILCSVADDRGKYHKPEITNQDYTLFKFKNISKKSKNNPNTELIISKVDFYDESLNNSCWAGLSKLYKIGYNEYNEYSEYPDYNRALDFLNLFSFVVPDEIWEKAYEIHMQNVQSTMNFWKLYEDKVSKGKRVSELLK